MKTPKIILTLTAIALASCMVGCKEETKPAVETTKEAAPKTDGVVTQATDAVKKTVESAKATGIKVIEDAKGAGAQALTAVTDKAKEIAAPASAKAQELIDSAKSLFSAGKFSDALTKLNATSETAPSVEQQTIIDSLRAQIEKAMAAASKATADATKSANDAVNKLLQK